MACAGVVPASNGVGIASTRLLSWTRVPSLPTRKLCPSATSRLKTGWVRSFSTASTLATPPRVRTRSPALRSRAIVQPLPTFQNRWIPVATTASASPSFTFKVGLGGLWYAATTGW